MITIDTFKIDLEKTGLVTDSKNPHFSFSYVSDKNGSSLKEATIEVGGEILTVKDQFDTEYVGQPLKPFTKYEAKLHMVDSFDETADGLLFFETGRFDTPWIGKWISDSSYIFKEKKVSPEVMTFRKKFELNKKVKSVKLYSTAMGIYDFMINGERPMQRFLAPGFTSYEHVLQYQVTDITKYVKENNTLIFDVAGGWAVGSYIMSRKNRIYCDRQALLCEIRVTYADGSEEVIGSDESFEVSEEGPYRLADIYDGEAYDENVSYDSIRYGKASFEKIRVNPKIVAEYGSPVVRHELFKPISCVKTDTGSLVYDFGQNFAGIVNLKIKNGVKGQIIDVKHSEILREDGHANTALLRSAKACIKLILKDGEQTYSPTFTYMGFRYVEISGIESADIDVTASALYSNIEQVGDFSCSDERLNQLNRNIVWSAKSNFVDIPTDCPQRDERMGWTGDIALFSPVANYNFDVYRLLDKWLTDVRHEQKRSGAVPTTVPHKGYGFPETFPTIACDFWGDAIILVPYSLYLETGRKDILSKMYEGMKRYVKACLFWANVWGVGKYRYIWHTLDFVHFGDWVAPGESMASCQSRHKWTATASLFNCLSLVSEIAKILGNDGDSAKYSKLSKKVANAYQCVFFDKNGKLKKKEFQTAYILPLHYKMLDDDMSKKALENLSELVKKDNYEVRTGFPGTPYLLFSLADNGKEEDAFKILLSEKCPSWLFEVKNGATTTWERFDGFDENGHLSVPEDGTGGMISFNHYAPGAVGDFLYKRILGLNPLTPGYKKFMVSPLLHNPIGFAQGSHVSPYGKISVKWTKQKGGVEFDIEVPTSCECELDVGTCSKVFGSGKYSILVRNEEAGL